MTNVHTSVNVVYDSKTTEQNLIVCIGNLKLQYR